MSQVTPSESSTIKKVGYDTLFLKYLQDDCGLKNVSRVVMHEALVNLRKLVIVQVKKSRKEEIRKALHAAATLHGGVGKITIAVDEDINPESLDGIFWALCFRTTFPDDIEFLPNMSHGHAPPFPKEDILTKPDAISKESYMLVDATLKEPFPPGVVAAARVYGESRRNLEGAQSPGAKAPVPMVRLLLGRLDRRESA